MSVRCALGENAHIQCAQFFAQELQAEGETQLFEQLKTFLIGGSDLPSYDEASTRQAFPQRQ